MSLFMLYNRFVTPNEQSILHHQPSYFDIWALFDFGRRWGIGISGYLSSTILSPCSFILICLRQCSSILFLCRRSVLTASAAANLPSISLIWSVSYFFSKNHIFSFSETFWYSAYLSVTLHTKITALLANYSSIHRGSYEFKLNYKHSKIDISLLLHKINKISPQFQNKLLIVGIIE